MSIVAFTMENNLITKKNHKVDYLQKRKNTVLPHASGFLLVIILLQREAFPAMHC